MTKIRKDFFLNINQFKLNKIKKLFFIFSFTGCIYSASEVLITLHADDSKLSRVLSAITEMGDYNIVTGPSVSVEENISIHLNEVPIEEAINLVVRAAGLSYEIVGKSILIAEPSKLDEDDNKIEEIWKKQYSLNDFTAATNFKSYEELKTRLDAVLSGTVSVGNVVEQMADEPIETPKIDTKEVSAPSQESDDDTMDYFQKLASE